MYRYHCEDEDIDSYTTEAYYEEDAIEAPQRQRTITKKSSIATDLKNSYAVRICYQHFKRKRMTKKTQKNLRHNVLRPYLNL